MTYWPDFVLYDRNPGDPYDEIFSQQFIETTDPVKSNEKVGFRVVYVILLSKHNLCFL